MTRRIALPAAVVPDPSHDAVVSFVVEGFVDAIPTRARWAAGSLECEPPLRGRAEVVVGMGEQFEHPEGGPAVLAAIDRGPTAALLTVLRALSRITTVEIEWAPTSTSVRPDIFGHVDAAD